jgi:hypothetical protein
MRNTDIHAYEVNRICPTKTSQLLRSFRNHVPYAIMESDDTLSDSQNLVIGPYPQSVQSNSLLYISCLLQRSDIKEDPASEPSYSLNIGRQSYLKMFCSFSLKCLTVGPNALVIKSEFFFTDSRSVTNEARSLHPRVSNRYTVLDTGAAGESVTLLTLHGSAVCRRHSHPSLGGTTRPNNNSVLKGIDSAPDLTSY